MALSLGFHIVFAEIGIAMPLLMVLAEWRWRHTGDEVYYQLAKRWAKGTAVLFAVGAVSGTVLSFELGLLWPAFMRVAGPIIGIPFSLVRVFTEAIFLGVMCRVGTNIGPRAPGRGTHRRRQAALSATFVVMVNAWMNTRRESSCRPDASRRSIRSPECSARRPQQVLHMLLAAYAATGLAVAGVHAVLLRAPAGRFHRRASHWRWRSAHQRRCCSRSGDISARTVAQWRRSIRCARGQFETENGAPLRIGGFPTSTPASRVTRSRFPAASRCGIPGSPGGVGIKAFPRELWRRRAIHLPLGCAKRCDGTRQQGAFVAPGRHIGTTDGCCAL
jgi:cytochrome d ubiquinol oxidase subunit I